MKNFAFFNWQYVLPISVILFLVYSADEINRTHYNFLNLDGERSIVEEKFKEMHPDLDHLDGVKWEECENLDEQSLERVCFEVVTSLKHITKVLFQSPEENFTYVPLSGEKPLQMERVIRRAPIVFEHAMNHTTYGTLINCSFHEIDVYLAQGNSTHVFRLNMNETTSNFHLRSLHNVTFKKS